MTNDLGQCKEFKDRIRGLTLGIIVLLIIILLLVGIIIRYEWDNKKSMTLNKDINNLRLLLLEIEENGDNIVNMNDNLILMNNNFEVLQQQHVELNDNLNIINDKLKYISVANNGRV